MNCDNIDIWRNKADNQYWNSWNPICSVPESPAFIDVKIGQQSSCEGLVFLKKIDLKIYSHNQSSGFYSATDHRQNNLSNWKPISLKINFGQ